MWDLIVSVPDHCLSFYFPRLCVCECGGGVHDWFNMSKS